MSVSASSLGLSPGGQTTVFVEALSGTSSPTQIVVQAVVSGTIDEPEESWSDTLTDKVYVEPVYFGMADVDVDSDNSGALNRSAAEDDVERDAPGDVLAVGFGQREPVAVEAEIGADFDVSEFTFTLTYDSSKIRLYNSTNVDTGVFIPSGTTFTSSSPVTVSQLLSAGGALLYMDGIAMGSCEIILTTEKTSGIYTGTKTVDKVKVTVGLDIDTDSDNSGEVDGSVSEDDLEDVAGSGIDEVGKRIFVNKDDDNKNGVPDNVDSSGGLGEDDFAEIKLDTSGLAALAGHELWIGCTTGLKLYETKTKNPLIGGQTSGMWYKWQLDGTGSFARTIFAEGIATGSNHVYWRLVPPGGSVDNDAIARDTVEINVEKIVYPFTTQEYQNWNERPTTDWVGLDVADAWHIEKPLVDYIKTPSSKGKLATIHPDTTVSGDPAATEEGADSTTTESYGDGFTMEFDYSFERSRNGPYGYVQAKNKPKKLSFVGNSGVKFGGKEVAILDIGAMVGKGGGITAFDPDQSGYVQSDGDVDTDDDYETEPLNKLMTGVLYDGDYAKMADNPDFPDDDDPDNKDEYFDTLENNYGRTNGHMRITVTKCASMYTISVYLDDEPTACYSDTITLSAFSTIDLQSHWGSGVIFSNMDMDIVAL